MKKLFSLLLLFISLSAFGQIERIAKFNFSDPTSLNPRMDSIKTEYHGVGVCDSIFREANIFIAPTSTVGAQSVTISTLATTSNHLAVFEQGRLHIYSDVDRITKIRFYGSNSIALLDGPTMSYQFGIWSDYLYSEPQYSVKFRGSNQYSYIDSIHVTYVVTQQILNPIKKTVEADSLMETFVADTLIFSRDIKLADKASFKLVTEEGTTYTLNPTVKQDTLILSLESELSIPGKYTITIPTGSVTSLDDVYYNNAISTPIEIAIPEDNFDIIATDPAAGVRIESIPNVMTLTFEGTVGAYDIEKRVELYNSTSTTPVARYVIEDQQEANTITINTKFATSVQGKYTLVVPSGMFYDINANDKAEDFGVSAGAKYNPETKFTFYVKMDPPTQDDPGTGDNPGGEDGPEIDHDPIASVSIIQTADSLLALTNPGYPSATSKARTDLEKLRADYQSTDSQYLEAFKAFYASKDIALPNDTTYRIANVALDGTKLYLGYEDGAITFTQKVEDACIFDATTNESGKTVFVTKDGHYLHTLVGKSLYSGTTAANVTSEKSAVNDLTIAKYMNSEYPDSEIAGFVTIYGLIGTNKAGTTKYGYSLVNTVDKAAMADTEGLIYFDEEFSSVFVIETKSRPYIPFTTKIVTDPVKNSSVAIADYVEVLFPELENVEYTGKPAVYLTTGKDSIAPTSIKYVSSATNHFIVRFPYLQKGTYKFMMPKGAFMCGKDTIQAETINFTVESDGFTADLYSTLAIAGSVTRPNQCVSSEVNHLALYDSGWKTCPYVSKNAIVELHPARTQNWESTVLATGTLEQGYVYGDPRLITNIETYQDYWYWDKIPVLNIKFDKVFEGNDLRPGIDTDDQYVIVVYEGAYGDENFAKYMKDPNSVAKADCHVNKYYTVSLRVQRTEAIPPVSIEDVTTKIDRYLIGVPDVTITDITDLIDEYLNQ